MPRSRPPTRTTSAEREGSHEDRGVRAWGVALETDLRGFMVGALQAEVANLDAYHRAQSAVYADRKVADAVPAGTLMNPMAASVHHLPGPPRAAGQNWRQASGPTSRPRGRTSALPTAAPAVVQQPPAALDRAIQPCRPSAILHFHSLGTAADLRPLAAFRAVRAREPRFWDDMQEADDVRPGGAGYFFRIIGAIGHAQGTPGEGGDWSDPAPASRSSAP